MNKVSSFLLSLCWTKCKVRKKAARNGKNYCLNDFFRGQFLDSNTKYWLLTFSEIADLSHYYFNGVPSLLAEFPKIFIKACTHYFSVFFPQIIALKYLWKILVLSFKKLILFLRYSNFCILIFPCWPLF